MSQGLMHAVVAGATGLVGGEVVKALLDDARCETVWALVHSEPGLRHPKLHFRVVDYDNLTADMIPGRTTALFCCLGTTIRKAGSREAFRKVDYDYVVELARLARIREVDQMLLISSLGADPKSNVFYSRVKGLVEQQVREIGPPILSIFRPSLLLGERDESRPGETIGAVLLKLFRFLLIGRWRKYRAIEASTVARAMVHIAGQPGPGVSIYESDMIAEFGRR